MSSRVIHVVACTRIFSLFKAEYYFTINTEQALLFIHPLDTWVFSQASVFLKIADVFLWAAVFLVEASGRGCSGSCRLVGWA